MFIGSGQSKPADKRPKLELGCGNIVRIAALLLLTLLSGMLGSFFFMSPEIGTAIYLMIVIPWMGYHIYDVSWSYIIGGTLYSLIIPYVTLMLLVQILSANGYDYWQGPWLYFALMIWAVFSGIWWFALVKLDNETPEIRAFLRVQVLFALMAVINSFLFMLKPRE